MERAAGGGRVRVHGMGRQNKSFEAHDIGRCLHLCIKTAAGCSQEKTFIAMHWLLWGAWTDEKQTNYAGKERLYSRQENSTPISFFWSFHDSCFKNNRERFPDPKAAK